MHLHRPFAGQTSVLGFAGWILSLPPSAAAFRAPPIAKQEIDATIAALQPPKRDKDIWQMDTIEHLPKQRVMPTLRITDYAWSKEFYVDGLGFQIDWEHRFEPHFPVFMQVSRDGLAFFLTEHTGDCPAGGLVHLYVPDVDAWYDEFRRKGVPVKEAPNESLQGLRSMTVVDPDGNKLHICTRLEGWSRA